MISPRCLTWADELGTVHFTKVIQEEGGFGEIFKILSWNCFGDMKVVMLAVRYRSGAQESNQK